MLLKKTARLLFSCTLFFSISAVAQSNEAAYILDMVHHNPGEALTISEFNNPAYLHNNGYTGQVINDFTFAHAALTFDRLNADIFPQGSRARSWVMNAADIVRKHIKNAHQAGIKVYYFTDLIVLPKKLVEKYKNEICDTNGKISLERPKTIEIHKLMFDELFEKFPDLDGLVIRTGETYLNNVPYHTGNNPILKGEKSHIKLLELLREEICVKRNKKIFYRTWSFGGMHEEPDYYLNVVNKIQPHPNLVFAIKHTKGDYQRTFDFNPTLGIGQHQQIVEVQCQREYEGKGAYPNYVMEGVINGFEEYFNHKPQAGFKGLADLKGNPVFKGVWSWSRGGGWVGPYISNEFWCRLNAYVISHWAQNTGQSELQVFENFMKENGITGKSATAFRKLCLLSAKGVVRGHASIALPFEPEWVWWMRDEFLGGSDPNTNGDKFDSEGILYTIFSSYHKRGLLDSAIAEKKQMVNIWKEMVDLSGIIKMNNKADQDYIAVSSRYGLLLHQIIAEGWNIMALGFVGDQTGSYDRQKLGLALKNYDKLWLDYRELKQQNTSAATLYQPYAFAYIAPSYHKDKGMKFSIDKYRKIINPSAVEK